MESMEHHFFRLFDSIDSIAAPVSLLALPCCASSRSFTEGTKTMTECRWPLGPRDLCSATSVAKPAEKLDAKWKMWSFMIRNVWFMEINLWFAVWTDRNGWFEWIGVLYWMTQKLDWINLNCIPLDSGMLYFIMLDVALHYIILITLYTYIILYNYIINHESYTHDKQFFTQQTSFPGKKLAIGRVTHPSPRPLVATSSCDLFQQLPPPRKGWQGGKLVRFWWQPWHGLKSSI